MALFQRRESAASAGFASDGAVPRRPHAGLLRRERRDLLQAREELLRQLGGLMVEMYRRNDYRDELLGTLCAQVVGIDDRLAEIDDVLGTRRVQPRCECGVPIMRGSRFCPSCGRDVTGGAAEQAHAEDS